MSTVPPAAAPASGWLPRWPYIVGLAVLTVVQLGGTHGAALHEPGHRALDGLAFAIIVAGPVGLLGSRRWPRQVLVVIGALTLLYLLRDYAYGPVFASFGLATIVSVVLGHRRTAWLVLAVLLACYLPLAAPVLHHHWSWAGALTVLAWALLMLAVGEVVRGRHERVLAARQARAEAARRAENEQKLQIARELHDVVAHHISLINVQAGVALHVRERDPEQTTTALLAIKDASKEALVELRSLVGVLRADGEAAPRTPGGGLDGLDALVERAAYAGVRVRKTETGAPVPLPPAVEHAAVRIVQESITNVVRHAHATHADIVLAHTAKALTISVADDGVGLPAGYRPGSGLRGMRERTEMLGGTLDLTTSEAGGALVRAPLPLARRAS